MDKFITLQAFSDIAGLVPVLVALVQFVKAAVDQVYKFSTRYLVFWLAVVILLLNAVAAGQFTGITAVVAVQLVLTILINGVIASLAAMKLYESVTASAVNAAMRGIGPPASPPVPASPTLTVGATQSAPPQPPGP